MQQQEQLEPKSSFKLKMWKFLKVVFILIILLSVVGYGFIYLMVLGGLADLLNMFFKNPAPVTTWNLFYFSMKIFIGVILTIATFEIIKDISLDDAPSSYTQDRENKTDADSERPRESWFSDEDLCEIENLGSGKTNDYNKG